MSLYKRKTPSQYRRDVKRSNVWKNRSSPDTGDSGFKSQEPKGNKTNITDNSIFSVAKELSFNEKYSVHDVSARNQNNTDYSHCDHSCESVPHTWSTQDLAKTPPSHACQIIDNLDTAKCAPLCIPLQYANIQQLLGESESYEKLETNGQESATVTTVTTEVEQFDSVAHIMKPEDCHQGPTDNYINVSLLRNDPEIDMDMYFYCDSCHINLDNLQPSDIAECGQCCAFHLCRNCSNILHNYCVRCLEPTMVLDIT